MVQKLSIANQNSDLKALKQLVSERSKAMMDIAYTYRDSTGPLGLPNPGNPVVLKRLERSGRYLLALVSDGDSDHLLPLVHERGRWVIDLVNLGMIGNKGLDLETMPRIVR